MLEAPLLFRHQGHMIDNAELHYSLIDLKIVAALQQRHEVLKY